MANGLAWPVFPFFFAGLWVSVCLLLSWIGGWAALARAYPTTTEFHGPRWRFRSAVVRYDNPLRYTSYGSCVTLGANAHALYLAVLPLFRIGHPPVLIPWADVRIAKHDGWFFPCLDFRFRRAEGIRLRLNWRLGVEVAIAGGLAVPT